MDTRARLLRTIAEEIEKSATSAEMLVAIDGVDGVGKTWFADELATVISFRPVIRASVDGFHHRKSVRYRRGKHSPEGYFEDSYNYPTLKKRLLDPLKYRTSDAYETACFDHRSDQEVAVEPRSVPSEFVLLFDGIFLHRPALAEYWNYSVLLEASRETTIRRCVEREAAVGVSTDPDDPTHRRYVRGQEIYFEICNPGSLATRVVNNENLLEPFLAA